MYLPRWLIQLFAAGGAAFAAAVGTTLVLAIVDLYLTGHGRPSLMRDWIS